MRAVVSLAVATSLATVVAAAACQYPIDACARDHTCQGDAPGPPVCMTGTSQPCMDATAHSDLTWIQANIFDKQCTFSGCHNGAKTPAGKLNLTKGKSYAHLVGYASALEPSRQIVVASDPKSSYLSVMLGIVKPADATPPASPPRADVGYMPSDNGGNLLCCQKLDAIDRWIMMGAPNN
jgi:hypothetical protein